MTIATVDPATMANGRKPVSFAWGEGTLTRADEIEALIGCVSPGNGSNRCQEAEELPAAIRHHLDAAREAACYTRKLTHPRTWLASSGPRLERASSNLDAAEALLLTLAREDYLLGQMPSLLNHVQRHLTEDDPRRREIERIAKDLGVNEPVRPGIDKLVDNEEEVKQERIAIITAVRGASSAALREQLRVRSFRNVLVAATFVLTLLAVLVAVLGYFSPTTVPLCFQPERAGQTVVVCPTEQSALLSTSQASGPADPDVDDTVKRTAARTDLLVVELVGLTAAAVSAAAAIRGIRGSSEPHGLPVALAVLKLPTGAITAFLGLLLMRGQFRPGLTALDTSGQILAWALVFGYAQQLFTRMVDQQGQNVLNAVRAANKSTEPAVGAP